MLYFKSRWIRLVLIERIIVIDCQIAGVSGDMMVGSLLDLGANVTRVLGAMRSVQRYVDGCSKLEVVVEDVVVGGFHAKKVIVKAEESENMTASELEESARKCLVNLDVSSKAKQFVLDSISTLVEAEAVVHGEDVGEVHLHESGSVDTLVDVIGAAVALEDLGLFVNSKIYALPVSVGGGLFKFSHGVVSSPAPATVEILRSKGFPMVGGPVDSELATPTGVSILVNLVDEVTKFYSSMKPMAVGYGAGFKSFVEMPNVLRVVLGEPFDYGLLMDEVYMLETSVDDVTGEVVGYTMDKLMQDGAKDVNIVPIQMKKGRPGHLFKVMVSGSDVEQLSRVLMDETGTLGVRVFPCKRHIFGREVFHVNLEIDGIKDSVSVKVAVDGKGKIVQLKPEYDDVKKLADKTNKPLKEIMGLAKMKAEDVVKERRS